MIDKMTKYSFILLSGDAPGFLKDLEGLGVVDITRSEKPVDDISGKLSAEAEACRKAINHLNAIEVEEDSGKFTVSCDGKISDPLALFQDIFPKERKLKEEVEAAHKAVENCRVWGSPRNAISALVGIPSVPENTCNVIKSPLVLTTCARRPSTMASSSFETPFAFSETVAFVIASSRVYIL